MRVTYGPAGPHGRCRRCTDHRTDYEVCIDFLKQGDDVDAVAFRRWLARHPEVAKEKDEQGRHPLYHGMAVGAAAEAMLPLLAAWPAAAKFEDNCGAPPLQTGAAGPVEVVAGNPASGAGSTDGWKHFQNQFVSKV